MKKTTMTTNNEEVSHVNIESSKEFIQMLLEIVKNQKTDLDFLENLIEEHRLSHNRLVGLIKGVQTPEQLEMLKELKMLKTHEECKK